MADTQYARHSSQEIARDMLGMRFSSNRAFLLDFLERIENIGERSVSAMRTSATELTPHLAQHQDRVGAWTVHLGDYELPEHRNINNIVSGDLFLQRLGVRKGKREHWVLWIISQHKMVRTNYGVPRTEFWPTHTIELKDGIVTEIEGDGYWANRRHTIGAPNMFRFNRKEARAAYLAKREEAAA